MTGAGTLAAKIAGATEHGCQGGLTMDEEHEAPLDELADEYDADESLDDGPLGAAVLLGAVSTNTRSLHS
jgi:hypothetical protein